MSLKCLFYRIKNLSERSFQTKVWFLVCASIPTPPLILLLFYSTLFTTSDLFSFSFFFFFFFLILFSFLLPHSSSFLFLFFFSSLLSPRLFFFLSPSLYPVPLISGSPIRPSFPSNGQRLTAATLLSCQSPAVRLGIH